MTVPKVRFHAVPRRDLVREFRDFVESGTPLVVVSGPLGSGKSSLISEWHESQPATGHRIIWASVRHGDSVPLACYLLQVAGHVVDPNVDCTERLLSLLAGMAQPTLLIIEDHRLGQPTEANRLIQRLVGISPNLQIVLATSNPNLLHLVEESADAAVIDRERLLFSEEEAWDLAQSLGWTDREAVRGVRELFGGWPLGVQTALTSQAGLDPREVGDRLAKNIISLIPRRRSRQVLAAVARFPGISLSDVAAGLDIPLSQVKDEAAFLWELGVVSGVPPATRETQLSVLPALGPEYQRMAKTELSATALRKLGNRAARLSEGAHPLAALEAYLNLGMYEDASALRSRSVEQLAQEGPKTLRLLRTIPTRVFDVQPDLLLLRLLLEERDDPHIPQVSRNMVRALRSARGEAEGTRPALDGFTHRGYALGVARIVGDYAAADTTADLVLSSLKTKRLEDTLPAWRIPVAYTQVALTYLLVGRLDDAAAVARRGYDAALVADSPQSQLRALGLLALADALADRIDPATQAVARFDQLLAGSNIDMAPASWPEAEIARLLVASHLGDLNEAERSLVALEPHMEATEHRPMVVYAEAVYRGEAYGPYAALARMDLRYQMRSGTPPVPDYWLGRLHEEHIDLALFTGQMSDTFEFDHRGGTQYLSPARRPRIALLREQYPEVQSLVFQDFDGAPTPTVRLQMAVFAAVAAFREGDWDATDSWLRRSAEVLDVVPEGRGTRARILRGVPYEWLVELLEHPSVPEDLESAIRDLPEHSRMSFYEFLSTSELEVLRALDSGGSLRAAADALFLSENTVKFHSRNIYRKLEVSGREEAIQKARRLRLL